MLPSSEAQLALIGMSIPSVKTPRLNATTSVKAADSILVITKAVPRIGCDWAPDGNDLTTRVS